MTDIFVFGSNRLGKHGGGAARVALKTHGAQWGVGEGRTGNAYALPTKADFDRTLTIDEIRVHADRFISYASEHPDDTFLLTQVGCGLAGLDKNDISPLFVGVPENVKIPSAWHHLIFGHKNPDRISFDF